MCIHCEDRQNTLALPRRCFLAGAVAIGVRPLADGLIEPVLRLAPAAGERVVALTLDACPGGFDWRIARVLALQRIPTTIFVTAVWMRQNRQPVDFLLSHRDIFALENHGAKHVPAVLGTKKIYGIEPAGNFNAILREVEDGAAAILLSTGTGPGWYRGAAGLYSPAALPAITALGFRIAGYSLNGDAGASLPAAQVASRIAAARDGDVIVAHINQPSRPSGQGVIDGVLELIRQGARFSLLP